MGLQIKNVNEVFNNLVTWITARTDKITDFNVGSAARTMSEAIAIQFEEFYFSMKQNVIYGIENSIYESFGFDKQEAVSASGYVTIEFEEELPAPMTFPQGTVFCTSAVYNYIYYESTEDMYAPTGSTSVTVPVRCKTEGITGNIPEKAITTIVTSNAIIKKVYNSEAFTNGREEETSADRQKRFQNYIKTLAKGTRDAIVYGALEVDGVTGAAIDDSYIGYVILYAHNSDGELPEDLRTAILENLENYRSGGIEVVVLPIVKVEVNLSLTIMIENDYDVDSYTELIRDLVNGYMEEYEVSKDFYLSDIIHVVKSAYEDVICNIMVSSGKDITVADNELIRPGTITITCVNKRDWRS